MGHQAPPTQTTQPKATGSTAGGPTSALMANLSILIIDDSSEDCMIYRRYLNDFSGASIHTANDAATGLTLADDHQPDCILLDFQLPDQDGLQLIPILRDKIQNKPLTLIMLTGMGDEHIAVDALKRGASDYLPKRDISRERLYDTLSRAIEKTQQDWSQAQATTKLATENQELLSLSNTDPLTSLVNRRQLQQSLDREFRRALRHQLPLNVLMIDIDYFKQYNDHFGHPAGDRALVQVAQTLTQQFQRSSDVVGRYGGEEFMLILPDMPPAQADERAKRLCLTLIEQRIPHPYPPSKAVPFLSLSVGLATCYCCRDFHQEQLIEQADRALYNAKTNGRNRAETVLLGEGLQHLNWQQWLPEPPKI